MQSDGAEAVERQLPANFHHSAPQFSAQSYNTHTIYNDTNVSLAVGKHVPLLYCVQCYSGHLCSSVEEKSSELPGGCTPEID